MKKDAEMTRKIKKPRKTFIPRRAAKPDNTDVLYHETDTEVIKGWAANEAVSKSAITGELMINGVPSVMHRAVQMLMSRIGLNDADEGLRDTPKRVVKFLLEYAKPILDVKDVLGPKFDAHGDHSMVTQSGIPFRMLCEHHLLPALGKASIGYIPRRTIIGLSKFTRLVQAVGTERPSLQEHIGERVADLLNEYAEPLGVIVVIRAEHSCMGCRGVNTPGVITSTSTLRGIFRDVPHARSEFFAITDGK